MARRTIRRVRGGFGSRRPVDLNPLRVKVIRRPVPGTPSGGWGGSWRSLVSTTPGLIGGRAPNSSLWMRAGRPRRPEGVAYVVHEFSGTAEVNSGIGRQAQRGDGLPVERRPCVLATV